MHKIENLKLEINEKDQELKNLQATNVILTDPQIVSYSEGKYTNEIRETIMYLITECGVSQTKVNRVIQTVLHNLTGKTLSRLPSAGVKSRLMIEAKMIANRHLLETLTDENMNFTLHQDGTSKHHRQFESFQVTRNDCKSFSAGIVEVGKGDAATLFDSFTTLLSDLADSISGTDKRKNLSKIVAAIIASMSDQGSVNHVFNQRFEEFRQDLLPTAFDNWETLSLYEQQCLGKLFSFFCKMHLFVNFASEIDKCLAQFEQSVVADGRNPFAFSSTESGITRLVRTACKAFSLTGDENRNGGDVQRKNVVNNVDKSSLWAP